MYYNNDNNNKGEWIMLNVMSDKEVAEVKVEELNSLLDKLAAQYKGKYVPNEKLCEAMRTRYEEMAIIANSNSGFLEVETIDPESDVMEISLSLPSLDLYRGSQTHFLSGIAGAEVLDVACDDEVLKITVDFPTIWQKVSD